MPSVRGGDSSRADRTGSSLPWRLARSPSRRALASLSGPLVRFRACHRRCFSSTWSARQRRILPLSKSSRASSSASLPDAAHDRLRRRRLPSNYYPCNHSAPVAARAERPASHATSFTSLATSVLRQKCAQIHLWKGARGPRPLTAIPTPAPWLFSHIASDRRKAAERILKHVPRLVFRIV